MRIRLRWPITLCLLFVLPSPSSAQRTATTFDQLGVLIEAGDKITVRDANGAETTGRLDSLSAHSLTIVSAGKHREWADTQVSRVFQRRQDSLLNGALWGAAAGGGTFGVLAAIFCSGGDCEGDPTVAGVFALYTGLGAAAGVGIDALITRRHVIFERPSHSAALSFSPILSGGRRGVALSLSY